MSGSILYEKQIRSQPSVPFAVRTVCPCRGTPLAGCGQIIVERDSHASTHPMTPELVVVCPGCSQFLVLWLRPGRQGVSAS